VDKVLLDQEVDLLYLLVTTIGVKVLLEPLMNQMIFRTTKMEQELLLQAGHTELPDSGMISLLLSLFIILLNTTVLIQML
jgi:hypothetical protein